ncbi:MAG: type II toxin-antitoxin system YafQ family toxin [Methylococcales bacterium]|nr:type II toxin-antitoxin system YafQ family toxin [Methylococcales bacterium]
MCEVITTSSFKKDYKRLNRSGHYVMDELKKVVELIAKNEALPEKYCAHPLTGNLRDCRECYIKPDWLLVYQLQFNELVLVRTGSHSELF